MVHNYIYMVTLYSHACVCVYVCVLSAIFEVTIGHETVMGKATFFSGVPPVNQQFDFTGEYSFLEELKESRTQVARYRVALVFKMTSLLPSDYGHV